MIKLINTETNRVFFYMCDLTKIKIATFYKKTILFFKFQ